MHRRLFPPFPLHFAASFFQVILRGAQTVIWSQNWEASSPNTVKHTRCCSCRTPCALNAGFSFSFKDCYSHAVKLKLKLFHLLHHLTLFRFPNESLSDPQFCSTNTVSFGDHFQKHLICINLADLFLVGEDESVLLSCVSLCSGNEALIHFKKEKELDQQSCSPFFQCFFGCIIETQEKNARKQETQMFTSQVPQIT